MKKIVHPGPFSAAVCMVLLASGITADPTKGAAVAGPAGTAAPPAAVMEAPHAPGAPAFEGHTFESTGLGKTGRPSLVSGRNVGICLALGGAALTACDFHEDRSIAAALDGSPLDGAIDAGDVFGNGLTAGAGALGLYAAGRLAHSERMAAAGKDLSESLLLTWGTVWTLKLLIDEDRPDGGDYSFPSGHTATAFATASVLTAHFGWAAGVPAYALAATTGLARLEDRRHYLGDVLVGAAIGLIMGGEVSSNNGQGVVRSHVGASGRGIGLRFRF